jgi:hypothetical protein
LCGAVLSALHAATAAAARDVYGKPPASLTTPLALPATPQSVKVACGTEPLAPLLPKLLPTHV